VDRIREKVQLLKNFPELGARVEDWETENIREIQEGNYRIIYRTKANFYSNPNCDSRGPSIAGVRENSWEG
jgi:plasmid stabilization system protein ParE